MKLIVDESRCSGYGCCVLTAPELFELDAVKDMARVINPHLLDELRSNAEAAVRSCPVKAITITDL